MCPQVCGHRTYCSSPVPAGANPPFAGNAPPLAENGETPPTLSPNLMPWNATQTWQEMKA